MEEKIENLLNMSMRVSNEERNQSVNLKEGFDEEKDQWEVIVKYQGDILELVHRYPNLQIKKLFSSYAIIHTPSNLLQVLARESKIQWMEKPKRLYFELLQGEQASCIVSLKKDPTKGELSGKGVIVAILDSGILPEQKIFRKQDGSTRILRIWDQTSNEEMQAATIDHLLNEKKYQQIIGRDITGHGTNVSAIACGTNGVADKADLIVVKMGVAGEKTFPRTTQLMEAVDYSLQMGIVYDKPVAINISFGNNYGDHGGSSLLENYLNEASGVWKNVICVGSGNEGLGSTHHRIQLQEQQKYTIELAVAPYQMALNIQIWKEFLDDVDIYFIAPDGKRLGMITPVTMIGQMRAMGVKILYVYGQPVPYSAHQEIYIEMQPENMYLPSGIWKIEIYARNIMDGEVNLWLPSLRTLNEGTGFIEPDSSLSCTIPSTAEKVISVGAYDARQQMMAAFSGRGYVATMGSRKIVKPEVVAPGVGIQVNENSVVNGTSFATPFVTGSAALMMEWGIVLGNDPYLYGEKLKAHLIKGAKRLPGFRQWPNEQAGWGMICAKESLS